MTKRDQPFEPDVTANVYDYIDNVDIDGYDPKIWYEILFRDIEATLKDHRDPKNKRSRLVKIASIFKQYLRAQPFLFASFGVAAYFLVELNYGTLGLSLPVDGLTQTALIGIATTAAFTVLGATIAKTKWHWVDFERNSERRRFYELRTENWRALEHRLRTQQAVYKQMSMNEDPDIGPKGLMGARLLGRHAWELHYQTRFRAFLFGFDVTVPEVTKTGFRIFAGFCLLAAISVAPILQVFSSGGEFTLSGLKNYFAWIVLPLAVFTTTFTSLHFFARSFVLPKLSVIKDLYEPKLSNRGAALIGLSEEHKSKFDWPEQWEYDDLENYLIWLRKQFVTLQNLRDQKYPFPTPGGQAENNSAPSSPPNGGTRA